MSEITVDREYVETYPLNWRPVSLAHVGNILETTSHAGIKQVSLYVHVPFCPQICRFCGFNVVAFNRPQYDRYVTALQREAEFYAFHPDWQGRQVTSVYFGGGTASMLRPEDLAALLARFRKVFPIADDAEVTVECHPATVNEAKFVAYRDAGANRVSLGLQSLNTEHLRFLGRDISAERLHVILDGLRRARFRSFAVDVMYRFPGQTQESLIKDLEYVLAYQPDGISAYSLVVEGSPMADCVDRLPTDAEDRHMFFGLAQHLRASGYHRTAQPDWARTGHECRYVNTAWRAPQGLMLGLGAGAHTHHFGGHIWANLYSLEQYFGSVLADRPPIGVGQRISDDDLMRKFIVLGVRCGYLPHRSFFDLFGCQIEEVFTHEIARVTELGWLSRTAQGFAVTDEGMWYIDNLSKHFYSADSSGQQQPWAKGLQSYAWATAEGAIETS